jgi:hypothetical protein
MLTGPARLSTPMARLRKTAMTVGAVVGADLRGVLGEGDIAEVVQCFDGPVPAQQVGQASGAGQLERQAGDRIDGHRLPPVGVQVTPFAGDLDDLGSVREPEVADRNRFEAAVLDAAMATVTGAVGDWDAVPGQAGAAVQQRGLVGLDHQQVVRLLPGDQELGGLGVGLQRVGGDHHS